MATSPAPGVYATTVTRPELFRNYLTEQIRLLIRNHGVPVEVGPSAEPIPLHFAFAEAPTSKARSPTSIERPLRDLFDVPDLAAIDDAIVNGTYDAGARRAAAARAVHRAARRLFAAPPAALHRHRARALPELRPLHQLPVLHRRVRASRRAAMIADGRGRLRRLRRAGQRGHAAPAHSDAGRRRRRRRACRRCRPIT